MKPIFPDLNNNKNNNKKNKISKLKLNSKERLNTFNNLSNLKSLKTEILSNTNRKLSQNLKTFTNNDFMESIEDYSKKTKYKPLPEYSKISDNLMERYTYYNPKAEAKEVLLNYENEMTRTKANYFMRTKNDIRNYLNKSKKLMKTMNNFQPQKTVVKFNSTNFRNPIDSLGLILKNKTIHDKVLNNYQSRAMQTFGFNITKINKIKGILNLTKHVKIRNVIPINYEKIMSSDAKRNNHIHSNNNDNKITDLKDTNNNSHSEPKSNFTKEQNSYNSIDNSSLKPINNLSEVGIIQKTSIYLLPGYYQPTKTCPESREEFSFNHDYTTNSIYLFSGNSSRIDSPLLWKFNLLTNNWDIIKMTNTLIEKRCGHTGIIYKNKLIIFGGRLLHNTALADIEIYNMDNHEWEMREINTSIYCKLRRNHVAALVGQQMFIHGGIDENGEYLDDSHLLNLYNYKWIKPKIIKFGKNNNPPRLAYHSCCLVVPSEISKNPRFNIYRFPEFAVNSFNSRIREKGIYIFGGKKNELKEPSNKLWVLRVGQKFLNWIELIPKGKPPCARYLFSMNYYEKGNFIIIHGGKTKTMNSEVILKDTYLFELFRMEWIKVEHGCFDNIIKPRFSHAGVIHNKKLIIFGGVNEQGFSGSNFFLIKLEPEINDDIFLKSKNGDNRRLLRLKTRIENNNNNFNNTNKDEKKNDNEKSQKKIKTSKIK